MSAIAYVTDAKMLEIHRIDRRHRANFWRLSSQNNFRDFQEGDLLFFLSKDKKCQRKKEKGIVGYGRAVRFNEASVAVMWKRYGVANGYDTLMDFKNAIQKVSKDHQLPKRISSIYLTDVNYFQTPIYLSDYGMNINTNIESYCYLKKDIVISILEDNLCNVDSWSQHEESSENIRKEIARYQLWLAQEKVSDFPLPEKVRKKLSNRRKKILAANDRFEKLMNSCFIFYEFHQEQLFVYFLHEDKVDVRYYLGQRELLQKSYAPIYKGYPWKFFYWDNDHKAIEME